MSRSRWRSAGEERLWDLATKKGELHEQVGALDERIRRLKRKRKKLGEDLAMATTEIAAALEDPGERE